MKIKSNKIKNMNDLIGGILLMAGGLWLMVSKNITEGRILQSQGQGIIQADTYIRMLGGLVFFSGRSYVHPFRQFCERRRNKSF